MGKGFVMFIGLKPSTADEVAGDPTIRRRMSFARDEGYSALCMTDLFAWRAAAQADIRRAAEPVGPDNDAHLLRLASQAGRIVAASIG